MTKPPRHDSSNLFKDHNEVVPIPYSIGQKYRTYEEVERPETTFARVHKVTYVSFPLQRLELAVNGLQWEKNSFRWTLER
jgi:hypothetical protein